MSDLPRLMGQGRRVGRHRKPPTIHLTQVRHVASCALYLCSCLITGPLRPTTGEAQQDADTHQESHA